MKTFSIFSGDQVSQVFKPPKKGSLCEQAKAVKQQQICYLVVSSDLEVFAMK